MPIFGVDGFDDLPSSMNEADFVGLLDGEFDDNRISAWMQTGRADAGEGICMGMCLDWMRRILTGMTKNRVEKRQSAISSMSLIGSDTKNNNRWEQQKNTHRVFKEVQAKAVGNWRSEQVIDAAIRRLRTIDPLFANVNTLAEAEAVMDKGIPGPHGRQEVARLRAMQDGYEREVEAIRANLGQPMDPRELLSVRLAKQSEILDALASVDSSIIPRYTLKFWTCPPSFGGLRVDGATSQLVQDPLSETNFLHFVEGRLAKLEGDRCGVLSMGRFGASGHDVAFYAGRNRTFFSYFDPTMGEFYFSSTEWKKLGKLLAASWRSFYGAKKNYDWVSWTNYAARA